MDERELHSWAARIEKQINDFRIVNPDGAIQGGFGELKRGATDIGERITNIQKAVANFNLTGGAGVNVEGSIGSGYAISVSP